MAATLSKEFIYYVVLPINIHRNKTGEKLMA